MAATASRSHASTRHDIFASVFPPPSFTTPTPETTPNIGVLASPGRPFGGFNITSPVFDDTIRFNRAWSTATRYLSLPLHGPPEQQTNLQVSHDVKDAMYHLCQDARTRKDLLAWYANETGVHFRQHVLPKLLGWQQPVPRAEAQALLARTMNVLGEAQEHYLQKPSALAGSASDSISGASFQSFRIKILERLHVQVLQSLPIPRLQDTLAGVFYQRMKASLGNNSNPEACLKRKECHCSLDMTGVPLAQLHEIGLGNAVAERAFAQAMHNLLRKAAIERRCFQVDWAEQATVVPMLRDWVNAYVTPFVDRSLAALTDNASPEMSDMEAARFAQIAVANLGRRRTAAIFEYVKSWPASTGAFLDIQEYLTCMPHDKVYVCDSFIKQAKTRLLHAGASTTEILSIYANVIHAFRLLDARGVLLEKVAHPLRSYLRGRDDTVAIIAASFLADIGPDGTLINADPDRVCADISHEVASSTLNAMEKGHKMLRFDDMNWVPDPIDAGPDYKASESEDVLAYVLGLFDQEDFIKEVTTVLAQHLLQTTDADYVKEIRLVELFKSRLDATKLQAAEVMLKDVHDSVSLNKRINPQSAKRDQGEPPTPRDIQAAIPEEGIALHSLYTQYEGRLKPAQFHAALRLVATKRHDLYFAKRTRLPPEPPPTSAPLSTAPADELDFRVQVLSSFFWPEMRANDFLLPPGFPAREQAFRQSFARLGNQRKLQFRHALARVDVRLEMGDRRVVEERDVPVWRASVIDVFARQAEGEEEADGITAERLMGLLRMEGELVLDALAFWTGKRVLYRPDSGMGRYAVLERLDMDTTHSTTTTTTTNQPPHHQHQQQPQHADTMISAVKTQDAMLKDNAPMFQAFIANMLRNGGPKEVGGVMGITGMLRMVLPVFTFGEEETGWLLGEMEGRGEVVRRGEVWSVGG
ncbi:hypothetical protein B0A55_11634 [Friedmanniomyces simplex]|uniref:Cullin family profile domain-containing protein n=1 Tax=Friedmanniomyces simplex TaxID=329884 RepID=A0A4U0WL30_9PEZI|nr:hypothetical protein B0A55_11634 [Friedmanniomyces simplex]